ncbi:MAG: DUF4010 domain-containing protein [Planctomycetales bacterium]|nr:DUF4010 domain-containing protein [Planctomycetales bacterium]
MIISPDTAFVQLGTISSTATTVSYLRRSREQTDATQMAASAIVPASTVVHVRVMIALFVVAPRHFVELAILFFLLLAVWR